MALALSAYRFGSEDGSESTHGWLANANTALDRTANNAATFFVRALVQATGAGQLNCDFQLQYILNGGTPTNVTTTSAVVKAVTTAIFADADNTTSRLGGTGTFESSSQGCSHDGVCGGTAFDIVTDGNGECLYSVQLVPADIAAGDTITFRLLVDGATFTHSVTPTINVTAPPPAITSIDTDNDTTDTRTGVPIVGTNFGAAGTGSFKVEISNNATYGAGTVVQITATYNSATSITATLRRSSDSVALSTLFTLPLSPAYLWVTNSTGQRNATGFQFTLRAAGATAMASANTTPTIPLNTTKYLRVRIVNSGGLGATAFRWAYSEAGGAWTPITTVSSVIRAVAAPDFANDEDVPNVLGNATNYVADNNAATEDGTISLSAALPANGVFESVLAFQRLSSAAIQIRLELNDGTGFSAYTNTPSIAALAGDFTGTPGVASVAITGQAPVFAASFSATPAVGTLTATGLAPTISAGATAVPTTVAATATGLAPSVSASAVTEPTPAALAVTGFEPEVSTAAAVTVEPGAGSLSITGFAPTVAAHFAATPDASSLTVAGFAPTIAAATLLEPSTAALAASGLIPEVAAGATLEPAAGSAAITGFAPTVVAEVLGTVEIGAVEWLVSYEEIVLHFTGTPPAGAVAATGFAPTVTTTGDVTVEPPTGALTATGLAPDVSASAVAAPGQATLVSAGLEPAITAGALLEPSTALLTASGFAPTVAAGVQIEAGLAAIVTATFAPTFTATALLEPAAGALTVAGQQPDVVTEGQYSGTPGTAALASTGLAPDVFAGVTLEAGQGSISISGFAPTVVTPAGTIEIGAVEWLVSYELAEQHFTGEPTPGILAATGLAPTVVAGEGVQLFPDPAALTLAGFAPNIAASSSVTAATAAIAATGLIPTVVAGQGATVEPTTAALAITGHAPDVQAISGVVLTPDTAVLAVTGHAPALEANHFLTAATGAVTVTCFAPSIIAGTGVILTAQTGSLVIVGEAPQFAAHFTAVANAANLVFTGWSPSLEGEIIITPPTASLVATGYEPFIISRPAPARRTYRVADRQDSDAPDRTRLVPVGGADRQFAATGRRRVFRVGRRSGSDAA